MSILLFVLSIIFGPLERQPRRRSRASITIYETGEDYARSVKSRVD